MAALKRDATFSLLTLAASCAVWAIPMSWIPQTCVLIAAALAVIVIIWKSEYTISYPWWFRLAIIGTCAIIFGFISFNAVSEQYKKDHINQEDLAASFEMNNALNLDNEINEIKVMFRNKGSIPSVVDDVSLIIIQFSDEKNDVMLRNDICDDPATSSMALVHQPGMNVAPHHPINLEKEKNASFNFYTADHYVVDGSLTSPPVVIDPSKSRGLSVFFKTSKLNTSGGNAVVWCPVLRFFDKDGHSYFTVCKGSIAAITNSGGFGGGPSALPPVQILPPPPGNTTMYYSCRGAQAT